MSSLVETQGCARSILLVVLVNVLLDKFLNAILVGAPIWVDLLGEVVSVAVGLSLQRKGAKAELDVVLGVEIDKFVRLCVFLLLFLTIIDLDRLLTPHLVDHNDAVVVKLDLLAMRLVVLSERVSNWLSVQDLLTTSQHLQVLNNLLEFANGRVLDKVLDDLLLL